MCYTRFLHRQYTMNINIPWLLSWTLVSLFSKPSRFPRLVVLGVGVEARGSVTWEDRPDADARRSVRTQRTGQPWHRSQVSVVTFSNVFHVHLFSKYICYVILFLKCLFLTHMCLRTQVLPEAVSRTLEEAAGRLAFVVGIGRGGDVALSDCNRATQVQQRLAVAGR